MDKILKIGKELKKISRELKAAKNFIDETLLLEEKEKRLFDKAFSSNGWRINRTEAIYMGNLFKIRLKFKIDMHESEYIIKIDSMDLDFNQPKELTHMLDSTMKDYKELEQFYKELFQFNQDFAKYFFTELSFKR